MLFENCSTGDCTDIVFRPFRRGDGVSFRQCIEDFYGSGYPYVEYLDEDFLLEKCAAGKMLVLCGVAKQEEIVSTSAARLDDDFTGSALLMLRVVKQAYRGMGVGKEQEERLLALVKKRMEPVSLYADVMTHDSVSQGSLGRRGFVLCGIRLMLYRNTVMLPGHHLAEDGKISQAVMCRRGSIRDVGILYCPVEHEAKVSDIYQQLGIICRTENVEHLPEQEHTDISWKNAPVHHSRICMVRRVGGDFPDLLKSEMESGSFGEDTTVLCYLNIRDRAAVFAYRELRQAGFFFTGLKPLQADEEYMLMAHIAKQNIRCRDIHLYGEGGNFLSYIQSHRNGTGGV